MDERTFILEEQKKRDYVRLRRVEVLQEEAHPSQVRSLVGVLSHSIVAKTTGIWGTAPRSKVTNVAFSHHMVMHGHLLCTSSKRLE